MKKLLAIATVSVFALSFGLAYADEMPRPFTEESKGLGWELSEGITTHVVDIRSAVDMKSARGAAAGGLGAEKAVTKGIDDRSYLGGEGSDLP